MLIWSALVGALRAALFALSHVYGGSLGGAVLTVSVVARVALLPVTIRAARRGRARLAALRALEPELKRIEARCKGDPVRAHELTLRLYRRRGISPVDRDGLVSGLAQWPILGALFSAVRQSAATGGRWLWVADLARPDALVSLIAGGLTYFMVLWSMTPSAGEASRQAAAQGPLVAGVSAIAAALLAWKASAAVALYWASTSAVGAVQSIILRRDERP